jgi:hypothetical protein
VTVGRHLVFPFLAAFLPTTKPEKSIADNITAAGVFWRRPKPVEKGLFTQTKPMCELVEGIVTVPRNPAETLDSRDMGVSTGVVLIRIYNKM